MAPQNTSEEPVLQEDQMQDDFIDRSLAGGRILASPAPGEEVVITGMAGRFPDSDDINHYKYNLLNKVDMISSDNRRWEPTHPEIPQRTGKINFIEKFDSGFFGIDWPHSNTMDPMCRSVLERAFEAAFDAGINPKELRGSKTGVFIGVCFSESERNWFYNDVDSHSVTGCTRSMLAKRVSYHLGLEGPSYTVDTACSSSLYAFEHAYRAIRTGRCDSAFVGGSSLCLIPLVSLQFARLGVLSLDGACKSFDEDANGYARSEAISVIYLQKSKDAKRIYAQVVHAKANCDGYKEQGITYPAGAMQKQLLDEVYQECNIDPNTVDFLEAHATGTKVGDPEEILAMDEVFCTNRQYPLYVGSIKSNLGHSEGASGMCSLVKVVLGMENDCLLPNLNFTRAREGAEALEKGRMIVVTDKIPWPKHGTGLAAVNSFGFGGANAHVVLKRFNKLKINEGLPKDDIPRLICLSGRTEDSITFFQNDIASRTLDAEYALMLHQLFNSSILGHLHRGYVLATKEGVVKRSSGIFDEVVKPLCLVFGPPNENLLQVGKELFSIPLFAASIQKIYNVLSAHGINVVKIITAETGNSPADVIIGSVAVQIGLVDLLKTLQVPIDSLIGLSIGELVAAYADESLTLEQTINAAFAISHCLQDLYKIDLESYTVELDHNKDLPAIPDNLEAINYNSEKGYIISGPTIPLESYLNSLINNGIALKTEKNYAFHTKHVAQIHSKLLHCLKQVIVKPRKRSSKWITSSVNKEFLSTELSKSASPEYFVNNLLSPVLTRQALSVLPPDSIVLEIGEKQLPNLNLKSVNLTQAIEEENYVNAFLYGLGDLYQLGYDLKLEQLYPKIQLPVSVGTPIISPLIKWNHAENWFVPLYKTEGFLKSGERPIALNFKDNDASFMVGHIIDGRFLFPATGYLVLVWESFSLTRGAIISDMKVVFERVKFHRATNIKPDGKINFVTVIQKCTGYFELSEQNQTVVSGYIRIAEDFNQETVRLPNPIGGEPDELRLTSKDIYKELRLRGYNYMGLFRGLKEVDLSATTGMVDWTGNWITFMDNMLQIKILQEDTRNLYVPTGIEHLAIDAKAHIRYAKQFGETDVVLPVYVHKETGVIKSGAIEIRGLTANSIARRKPLGEPVLETHKFIPLETKLSVEQSIRVNTQIILENNYGIKIRAVELIDEFTKEDSAPVGPLIHEVLVDQPLIQPTIIVLAKENMELSNVTVEDKKLTSENHTCALVVVSKLSERPEIVQDALGALKENGFILSREELSFNPRENSIPDFEIYSVHENETEKLVLLRKSSQVEITNSIEFTQSANKFEWLPEVQAAVKNDETVLLYSQGDTLNGILGFVNCLRREPGGLNIKCLLVLDNNAPKFDLKDEFYSKQLKKGLAVNIYKDGQWGTYRHLLLNKSAKVKKEHIYNNVLVRGDLSSLSWIEGPITSQTVFPPEKTLIYIYYAALNFRDVMTASGRISNDVITRDRLLQSIVQGFEFAGRDAEGNRYTGMVTSGALASMVTSDTYLLLPMPDQVSMEEAVTVPVTYSTVLHALENITKIKKGQTILIHSGTGGIGQAAINVAIHHGCEIFTTVGTQEKKEFIMKRFPQLLESHIGNSRDITFEQMVMKETNGRGVDYVLNSLADDKLQASVRCLAPGGAFLEIGKFDLMNNTSLGLQNFSDGRSFHGVMVDAYMTGGADEKRRIVKRVEEGIETGCVRPFNQTVFDFTEVEQAFRYMGTGKHTGKVIIKMREEEADLKAKPETTMFDAVPRFYGDADKSYIISGGLGGFGLELADWIILRGVRKLVLVSRNGVKTGYQASRLRIWKNYGVDVVICSEDVTTLEGCRKTIQKATNLGPVKGIFNLAVVLKDALLENQTEENFQTSLAPKAISTQHFDQLTRKLCPELEHFVVFSSVSCGRGNAGQTNYGMSNSIMERVCEKRKIDGLPGLAIQWGAIGEVGLVAEMQELHTEIEIGGTLQQKITSCLDVMDQLLSQDEPIVSSIVVAEKRSGAGGANNIVDAVKNIIGLRDLKTISHHSTLSELGMDSMMAVEIKQTLEREYEVFLTAQDIRSMTFAKLHEIALQKAEDFNNPEGKEEKEKLPEGIYLLLRDMGDESKVGVPVLRLPSLIKEKSVAPKVFLLPGIEGLATVVEPLAANLASHAICLQYTFSDNPEPTIEAIAKSLLPHVQENLPKSTPFTLVAYSYGVNIAVQLASYLEAEGRIGRLILIDGGPAMFKELFVRQAPECNENDAILQTLSLCGLMQLYMPVEVVLRHKGDIYNCKTFEERLNLVLSYAPENTPYSEKYQRQACIVSYLRLKSILLYQPTFRKLKSMVRFFKPSRPTLENFDEDYRLQELCENPIEISVFEGNHLTILKNPQVANAVNTILDTSGVFFKQSLLKDKAEIETLKEISMKQI